MIQITPQMRILLAIEPTDFRRGIDGLCRVCRDQLKSDPFLGTVFVFRNRSGTSLKCLVYDGQGFWLCQKRLSVGKFAWWPKDEQVGALKMAAHELQLLLWNGSPSLAQAAPQWRPLAVAA
jgi:transposase